MVSQLALCVVVMDSFTESKELHIVCHASSCEEKPNTPALLRKPKQRLLWMDFSYDEMSITPFDPISYTFSSSSFDSSFFSLAGRSIFTTTLRGFPSLSKTLS